MRQSKTETIALALGTTALAAVLLRIIVAIVLFVLMILAWVHAKRVSNSIANSTWKNPSQQGKALTSAKKARNYAGAVWMVQLALILIPIVLLIVMAVVAYSVSKNL